MTESTVRVQDVELLRAERDTRDTFACRATAILTGQMIGPVSGSPAAVSAEDVIRLATWLRDGQPDVDSEADADYRAALQLAGVACALGGHGPRVEKDSPSWSPVYEDAWRPRAQYESLLHQPDETPPTAEPTDPDRPPERGVDGLLDAVDDHINGARYGAGQTVPLIGRRAIGACIRAIDEVFPNRCYDELDPDSTEDQDAVATAMHGSTGPTRRFLVKTVMGALRALAGSSPADDGGDTGLGDRMRAAMRGQLLDQLDLTTVVMDGQTSPAEAGDPS